MRSEPVELAQASGSQARGFPWRDLEKRVIACYSPDEPNLEHGQFCEGAGLLETVGQI